MVYIRKTCREKLNDDHGLPKVVKIKREQEKRWGKGTIVIPAAREVEALMKAVPKGRLTTINQIRKRLAANHNVTIACPIVTGIFARIAAGAAAEDAAGGKKRITPYWRTLKEGGVINEKYPGGMAGQKKLLEQEGFKVMKKGKKYVVKDYENYLIKE